MSRKRKSFIQKYYKFENKKNQKFNITRITMPFTIQCSFCSTFTFKGTKQNALKKLVKIQMGAEVFSFFVRCKQCNNEMGICTNPVEGKYEKFAGCSVFEDKKLETQDIVEKRELQSKKEKKSLDEIEKELVEEIRKDREKDQI